MSRRFRICMAKGGRESLRSRYGRSKLTLISSQKKKPKTVFPKTLRPQFSYFSLVLESAVFWYIRNIADSISRLKSENCGRKVFRNTYLFLLATRISPASPNFGQAKQGQKFVVPTFHIHQNTADSRTRLNFENCGRKVLGNTALFLLATRVLPASPNFGQAKHGQNGPAATDCQQCIFYPICGHHFTHRTHTDISFRFRPGGRRLKNFRFSRIFISLW